MIIGGRTMPQAPQEPEQKYSDVEFMRGFLEGAGGQGVSSEAMSGLSQQAANQKGGMASPTMPARGSLGAYGRGPARELEGKGGIGDWFKRHAGQILPIAGGILGGPLGGAVGGMLGSSISSRPAAPPAQMQAQTQMAPGGYAPSSEMTAAFEQAMMSGLQGQGTLPQSIYETQYGQARAGIAAQAQRAQEQMVGGFAGQGMLRSGMAAQGLQGLQEAQLQAQGGVMGQMASQRILEQRNAQRQAMEMYAQMQGIGVQGQQVGVQAGYLNVAQQAAEEERQRQLNAEIAALIEAWQRRRQMTTYTPPTVPAFPLEPPGGTPGGYTQAPMVY